MKEFKSQKAACQEYMFTFQIRKIERIQMGSTQPVKYIKKIHMEGNCQRLFFYFFNIY